MQPANQSEPSDALTIAAIAVITYVLGSVVHEAVGHGGACLACGGKVLVISTVQMECSRDTRLVLAGGTLMNAVAGALYFALGRLTPRTSARLKYFLWISMTVNL